MGTRLRPNTFESLSALEQETALEQQTIDEEAARELEPTDEELAAQQAEAAKQAEQAQFQDKVNSIQLPKNPSDGVLNQTSVDVVGSIASRDLKFSDIGEFVLKATQAEENDLNALKDNIDKFEKKQFGKGDVVDLTPLAALVDTLTGSNLKGSVRPTVSQFEKDKQLLDLRQNLATREAKIRERKLDLMQNIFARGDKSDIENFRAANRKSEIILRAKLKKERELSLLSEKIKLKSSPKTLDEKVSALKGADKTKYFFASSALSGLMDMEKALIDEGENTFRLPFTGDNNFTRAKNRWVDDVLRARSGAAVTKQEEARIKKFSPTAFDSHEMQKEKLSTGIAEARKTMKGLGIDPDEFVKQIAEERGLVKKKLGLETEDTPPALDPDIGTDEKDSQLVERFKNDPDSLSVEELDKVLNILGI